MADANEELRLSEVTLSINKGCSLDVVIEIMNEDGTNFQPELTSKVIFAMRKKGASTTAISQELEHIRTNKYQLSLTATQTSALTSGRYLYGLVYTESNEPVIRIHNNPLVEFGDENNPEFVFFNHELTVKDEDITGELNVNSGATFKVHGYTFQPVNLTINGNTYTLLGVL